MEMRPAMARPRLRLATLLCLAAVVATTGCRQNDYLARRDSVTLGAGDASAVNRVVHTVDPWPGYVTDQRLPADGERMGLAVKRYRANESLPPRGLGDQPPQTRGGQTPPGGPDAPR